MITTKFLNFLIGSLGIVFLFFACTSDPIAPPGGIPGPPPIQDPGDENLCDEGIISFQHEILPIMVSSCAYSGCHDAITAEDDIILDSYDNIMKEVRPGDPGDSELYESITENEGDEIMPPPPPSPLTSEQISTIREWILQGAHETDCGTPCDSTQSSFAANIYPLLNSYCIGCHNSTRADADVDIDSYEKILPYVENGVLMGTIRHDQFFAPMPPTGSQISDCRIAQIQKWIDEGAQNN